MEKPEDIITDICYEVTDEGIYLDVNQDKNKFHGKFYISLKDKDNIFCDPEDELDWLSHKPFMLDFYSALDRFGERDKDYFLYGGMNTVNIVFKDKNSIKL